MSRRSHKGKVLKPPQRVESGFSALLGLSLVTLKPLYNALVRSLFEYCAILEPCLKFLSACRSFKTLHSELFNPIISRCMMDHFNHISSINYEPDFDSLLTKQMNREFARLLITNFISMHTTISSFKYYFLSFLSCFFFSFLFAIIYTKKYLCNMYNFIF